MLGRNASEPAHFQMIDLASLVPPDHRPPEIDAVLDLAWVRDAVSACDGERGRPGTDPELFLRMLLLGRLYDLSDRELCAEISMHAGMRWFSRLQMHDAVPDHSTLSKQDKRPERASSRMSWTAWCANAPKPARCRGATSRSTAPWCGPARA